MKQNQIDYYKALSAIEKTISNSSFYWQSLSLIFCFITSYLAYRRVKKFVFRQKNSGKINENNVLSYLFTRHVSLMLYPIIAVIFLAIGLLIYSQFFKEVILFSTTLKLFALFLFLRFLRISSGSNFITNVIGLFLMPALILDIFGLLDSTIAYLDEYAVKIGDFRISIYLFIKAFFVLLVVFWLSDLIKKKSKSYVDSKNEIKSSTKNIINKLIDIFIYAVVFIILLKTFGVDFTTLAVIGGAVGVGIGFGLQKIASNFISGIILLFEKAVEIGDIVELDNGNIFGTIKHFSGRYTLIEGFDGKEIMIPNEDFIISKVSNWTHSNNRARVEINLGVAYGSDLETVREVIISCARENIRCLSYPEIECFVTGFGDFDVKFVLYFWISDIAKGRMAPKSEVLISIWKKLKENNIEIPLPKTEVKVVN